MNRGRWWCSLTRRRHRRQLLTGGKGGGGMKEDMREAWREEGVASVCPTAVGSCHKERRDEGGGMKEARREEGAGSSATSTRTR
eukprot:349629-Chlamydomonas_euryale.AAC.3